MFKRCDAKNVLVRFLKELTMIIGCQNLAISRI